MKIEIRSANEAVIEGYVNAVERDSRLLPRYMCPEARSDFVEQVKAGAFKSALNSGAPVNLMYNHEKIIGKTDSNLELREDSIGLYAKAVVTDPVVIHKAKSGELRGWSFGFNCLKDSWEDAGENKQRRFLQEIKLLEVSILDKKPAYIGTSIEMRCFDGAEDNKCCVSAERRGTGEPFEIVDNSVIEAASDHENRSNEIRKMQLEVLKKKGL